MANASLPSSSVGRPPFGFDGYQLRLPSFEGPLDVLLRLVEREHLPIAEVSLVAVTQQFLDHLDEMGEVEPSVLAAFGSISGRLLVLKSRSLLPRPVPLDEVHEPDDLVSELERHRLLKTAALELARHDHAGYRAFPRPLAALSLPTPEPPRLVIHQSEALARALRRRLATLAPPPAPAALRAVVTLQETIGRLHAALRRDRHVSLRRFLGQADRDHRLVAFLAVLMLLRRRSADADQPEPFGDILVSLVRSPVRSTD